MKHVEQLIATLSQRLEGLARGNAVVAKPISVGDRHAIPLCELSLGFGAGGGIGEGEGEGDEAGGMGMGGGAGGAAKASPVAVVIVDGGRVRIQGLGR